MFLKMLENCFQRFPPPLPEKNTTQVLKTCDPITYIETGTSTPVPERLFLIKLQVSPATLLKKRLWDRCFHVNFAKFLRTAFFIEHLWWPPLVLKFSHYTFLHKAVINPPPFLKRLRWTTALQQYTFLISN